MISHYLGNFEKVRILNNQEMDGIDCKLQHEIFATLQDKVWVGLQATQSHVY